MSRVERKSQVLQEEEEEKLRFERMSLDEKAAVRRKERKTKIARTGGLDLMVKSDNLDEEALRNQLTSVKLTTNNYNTYRNSHTKIAENMANRSPLLSPLSKAIHKAPKLPGGMYGAPRYELPDDITLLPFDDFAVNDVIRSTAVPSLDIADKGGQVIKKDKFGKRHGVKKPAEHNLKEARRAAPRKTLMEKFRRTIRMTAGLVGGKDKEGSAKKKGSRDEEKEGKGEKDEEDDDEEVERKPRKSRVTFMAQKAGMAAAEGGFIAGTEAIAQTGKLTGSILRMTTRAVALAARTAEPHINKTSSIIGKQMFQSIQQKALERKMRASQGDPNKKVSRSYKKKWMAACVIQRNFRIFYEREGGLKHNRAARTITQSIKDYISMINMEKWHMVIEMELKDKRDREDRKTRATLKNEKSDRLKKQIRRAGAERAAKAVGWGSSAMKTAKWTPRDQAIVCACFMKFGFPVGDADWQMFYKYFPEKPRRNVRTKLNAMKDDGMLSDPATMNGIDKKELQQLGLQIVVKKKDKKKAINLQDLL